MKGCRQVLQGPGRRWAATCSKSRKGRGRGRRVAPQFSPGQSPREGPKQQEEKSQRTVTYIPGRGKKEGRTTARGGESDQVKASHPPGGQQHDARETLKTRRTETRTQRGRPTRPRPTSAAFASQTTQKKVKRGGGGWFGQAREAVWFRPGPRGKKAEAKMWWKTHAAAFIGRPDGKTCSLKFGRPA